MKRKLMLFLSLLFISVGIATAQTQVRGVVVDEAGEPVIGATIQIKGTSQGTITDFDGNFAFSAPANARLVISYVGMVTQEIAASPNMKITMQSDSELLEEVMVVAFGTAKKSAFTGSAKVIDTEQLAKSQVTSVTNALAGAVPGLQLTSNSGAPGATSSIKIRGFSSLNAGNDPLIILDGAPYSGDLGNLNPNDVESMTVLKDAASNALYGARGANGVIMITTKSAKRGGGAKITFDAKIGGNVQALKRYNTITNPAQYLETHYGALTSSYITKEGLSPTESWDKANNRIFGDQSNGGLGYNVYSYPEGQRLIGMNGKLNPEATLGRIENYRGDDYLLIPDDWSNIGTRTGVRQEYNLSIAGSSEKSTFYLSLGYLDNEGITEASNMQRLTTRLRADYQAKDWLKVGANMSYANFTHNSLANNGSSNSSGNIWAFTSQMAPIYPAYIRNADGSIKVDADDLEMMDYGDGKNAGYSRPFISNANPIMDSKLNTNHSEGNATSGSGFMDFTFIPELKLTINGAFNLDESRITYAYNPYYGQFDTTGGLLSKYHTRRLDYNLQQLLNYSTSFNNNNFDILLGHEYYNYQYYELGGSTSKMFSQKNLELGGAVLDEQSANSFRNRDNNEGYFTRVQYNNDDKIFASASFRRDASSKFHPDHRWGNFWSVGGAWLLNKEDWYDIDWLDELKVKASYGSQGNDAIGRYRYTDVFNIVNADGNIGTSFESKGTKDITWETNANFNIGTEFSLFNRVTGSLEFYNRKTTDMLFSFSVAPSLGYSSYFDNIGDMYNRGFELELAANIFNTKDFSWDVNFNLSTLKNGITMLADDKKTTSFYDSSGKEYKGYTSGNFFIGEDVSMYTWRLKEYAGVSEEGESMWYKTILDADGNFEGRETTTVNADADYYVSNETTIPDLYGGFGTSLQAYGFDFNINFSYQIGGKQYDSSYARFMGSPTGSSTGYNFHADIQDSWTPENTSSDIPRFMYGDLYTAAGSTRFLTDASYLNIENINLGYTLPKVLTQKAQINSIRIYASAENVFYWSKRKGFDPRQSYSATTNATHYSPMRTISGGITLNF